MYLLGNHKLHLRKYCEENKAWPNKTIANKKSLLCRECVKNSNFLKGCMIKFLSTIIEDQNLTNFKEIKNKTD